MEYSDIQLADKTLWNQLQTAWKNANYSTALSLKLANKKLIAEILNNLTDKIVDVEQLDDATFGADKIQVTKTAPSGLKSGQVYFELTD